MLKKDIRFIIAICIIILSLILYIRHQNTIIDNLEQDIENLWNEGCILNLCPICDNKVTIYPVNDRYYIKCNDCGLNTDYFDSINELEKYWNKE